MLTGSAAAHGDRIVITVAHGQIQAFSHSSLGEGLWADGDSVVDGRDAGSGVSGILGGSLFVEGVNMSVQLDGVVLGSDPDWSIGEVGAPSQGVVDPLLDV